MLKEEQLDRFLDVFLDGRAAPEAEPDLRESDAVWEETAFQAEGEREPQPDEEDYWERQRVILTPVNRGKLPARTVLSIFLLTLAIPLTIWAGLHFFHDRKYLAVSLIIAVYSLIPFFMVFEGRKPQTRELMTISVLVAVAVAGRAAFFMAPSFKPVAAVTILAGVSFGAESGFLVGAVSMLVSNMLFGQGPWAPWQMCAMGLIGFTAGVCFQKGWLAARRGSLCVFGFFATLLIYGGIMNPASLVMYSYAVTPRNLLIIYMSGLPMDLVHAASTVIFLWLAGKPMLEKLERIKVKYGLFRGT